MDLGSSENGLAEAVEDTHISIICQPAGYSSQQLRITDADFKDGGQTVRAQCLGKTSNALAILCC